MESSGNDSFSMGGVGTGMKKPKGSKQPKLRKKKSGTAKRNAPVIGVVSSSSGSVPFSNVFSPSHSAMPSSSAIPAFTFANMERKDDAPAKKFKVPTTQRVSSVVAGDNNSSEKIHNMSNVFRTEDDTSHDTSSPVKRKSAASPELVEGVTHDSKRTAREATSSGGDSSSSFFGETSVGTGGGSVFGKCKHDFFVSSVCSSLNKSHLCKLAPLCGSPRGA